MTQELIELVGKLKQLESDVQFYSGNEASGYAEIARLKSEIAEKALPVLQAQSARIAELEGEKELSELCAKIEADAVSGLRYIERRYGRLEGVGWGRVFNAHDDLFARASLTKDSTSAAG